MSEKKPDNAEGPYPPKSSNINKRNLYDSIIRGNVECVENYIKNKLVDPDTEIMDDPLLSIAIKHNKLKIVTLLLNTGANVNYRNIAGWTPLHFASYEMDERYIKCIMKYNPKIDVLDNDRKTPLHFACMKGNIEIVKILCDSGISVDERDRMGFTPFNDATRTSNLKVMEYLIRKGANVNNVTYDRMTSLHFACEKNNFEVVELLLNNGGKSLIKNLNGNLPIDLTTDKKIISFLSEYEKKIMVDKYKSIIKIIKSKYDVSDILYTIIAKEINSM